MLWFDLKSHFFPHAGNDYAPKLLQKAAMLGMLLLILLSFLAANLQALLWQSSPWMVGTVLPAVIVDLTNTQRQKMSLPTLTRNTVLDAAAKLKAENMAEGHYFSHDSPSGVTPWYWFDIVGYTYTFAGENLAVYFTDSDAVVDAWMKSPTHRANIVGANYKEIGVGTAKGTYNGYDTVFVVQLFGSPAIKPAPVVKTPPVPVNNVPVLTVVAKPVSATTTKPNATTTKVLATAYSYKPLVAGETVTNLQLKTTFKNEAPIDKPVAVTDTDKPVLSEAVTLDQEPKDFDSIAVYSDFAATSTNLAPAFLTTKDTFAGEEVSRIAKVATKPNVLLQVIYLIIGFFITIALLASVILEWRQHRPLQTAYGVGLLAVMIGLFYIHIVVTYGVMIL